MEASCVTLRVRTCAGVWARDFRRARGVACDTRRGMDDRMEREAAQYSISVHREDILELCDDSVELLDAFEQLNIITTEEKDDANANEDYDAVLGRLSERMDSDPEFFVDFCRYLKSLEESSAKILADSLLRESSYV